MVWQGHDNEGCIGGDFGKRLRRIASWTEMLDSELNERGTMKIHMKYKGAAQCGRKAGKNGLKFVTSKQRFDDLPEDEKCKNCERSQER